MALLYYSRNPVKLKVEDGLDAVLFSVLLELVSCCFLSLGRNEANVNVSLELLLSFAKDEKPEFEDEAAKVAKPLLLLELKAPIPLPVVGRLVWPKAGATGREVAPNAGSEDTGAPKPGREVVPKAGVLLAGLGLGKVGLEVTEKPAEDEVWALPLALGAKLNENGWVC